MKTDLAGFDEATRQKLDNIKRDKLNWVSNADEIGINIDEELDEEEIGSRFTQLKPERQSRFNGER